MSKTAANHFGTASESPRVVFRCDASVEIGSGHVMRCLTLADKIAHQGGECTFLCRDLPGHMMGAIAGRGHAVQALPAPARALSQAIADPAPVHAAWLGVPVREDMEQTRTFLERHRPDRVIVDHYALDATWESGAIPVGVPIMVIDDLADRQHLCDLLLDQNLGRRAADYDALVPAQAQRLIGPHFALLRPEFADLRPASMARRQPPALKHVLVAMGGMDRDDTTSRVLDSLAGALPNDCRVSVVMGQDAPFLENVRARAAHMPMPISVLVGVADMATLMAGADLAIGAAGGTAWERCCLGLPTLLLALADNQRPGAEALHAAGAAVLLGAHDDPGWPNRLTDTLKAMAVPSRLAELSAKAAEICDAEGTNRVVRALTEMAFSLHPADPEDARRIWEWRNADDAARFYRSPEVPSYEDHLEWYGQALGNRGMRLLILRRNGIPTAHIRFNLNGLDAEISIYVSPGMRGKGIGKHALAAACNFAGRMGWRALIAEVHRENQASLRLFESAGFVRSEDTGRDFHHLERITARGE